MQPLYRIFSSRDLHYVICSTRLHVHHFRVQGLMVLCAVLGCNNHSERDKHMSYYCIPKVRKFSDKHELELLTKQRDGFLARINRADLTVEVLERNTKMDYRVCSRHISGKPAYLYDETNPDWLPSINLGHSKKFQSQGKDDAR